MFGLKHDQPKCLVSAQALNKVIRVYFWQTAKQSVPRPNAALTAILRGPRSTRPRLAVGLRRARPAAEQTANKLESFQRFFVFGDFGPALCTLMMLSTFYAASLADSHLCVSSA